MPARITTDRGTQFTSGTWGDWCQKQGVQHITTTAYHQQANGMVERIHRTLKAALCARGGAAAWKDHLTWVLLGMQAAPRDGGLIGRSGPPAAAGGVLLLVISVRLAALVIICVLLATLFVISAMLATLVVIGVMLAALQ